MPNFGDLEREAQQHDQQVDKVIGDAQQDADQHLGGDERKAADEAATLAEREVAGQGQGQPPSGGDPSGGDQLPA